MEFLMQPIRGSAFLEEVGESLVSPSASAEPPVVDMLVEDQVALPVVVGAEDRAVATAEAQILMPSGAAAERRENSPPSSEMSTGKMNPRAPGWTKRLRIGAAAPSRAPCPNRVSAFERAVRSYADNPSLIRGSENLLFISWALRRIECRGRVFSSKSRIIWLLTSAG